MTTMNKWTPTTNLLELRRLGKTVEELGELVAVLGRTVCQGLDGIDPASGDSNIERITKESADVIAQIGCNVKAFQLDQARIDARAAHKTGLMAEWEALFEKPTRVVDAAGTPKVEMTYLEREAVGVLNTVKAWRDCEGNDGFPHEARERIDALLMTFEQRRKPNPSTQEGTHE